MIRLGWMVFVGARMKPFGESKMHLNYVIKFVSDMEAAVAFHRDKLGLQLNFMSPHWSEFATGPTTLALHPACDEQPAGTVELGFNVETLDEFYDRRDALGLGLIRAPSQAYGVCLARIRDSENVETAIYGPAEPVARVESTLDESLLLI